MEREQFMRTELLYGAEALEKLQKSHVAIFGVGGVGGYAAEALVRTGVGAFTLIDNDTVACSNLNRQIIATQATIGRPKAEAARERMLSICPEARIEVRSCFYLPECREEFDFSSYDYVVDAIDTVTAKLDLIVAAKEAGTPVISCMGAGNKLHPEMFEVADIYQTSVCPLAKVMRRELKKRGVTELTVVYSKEEPRRPADGGRTPGSTSFSPAAAGLILASVVVGDLTGVR